MLSGLWQFTRLLHFCTWFSFPFVFVDSVSVDFLFSVAILNGQSRDFVVPLLLTLHPCLEYPEAGSAELQEEVEQVVAAGWHEMVHVEVLAHEIWISVLFWTDLAVQLSTTVR